MQHVYAIEITNEAGAAVQGITYYESFDEAAETLRCSGFTQMSDGCYADNRMPLFERRPNPSSFFGFGPLHAVIRRHQIMPSRKEA